MKYNLRNILLLVLFLGSSLLFLYPIHASTNKAQITNFFLKEINGNIAVYLNATNCFTKKMDEAIFAGIPVTFRYFIQLNRKRRFWFDKKESRLEIKHTIKYDNVKQIFTVSYTENKTKPDQFQKFSKARFAMSHLDGVIIKHLKKEKKSREFYVKTKAKLDKVTLPSQMEYVFFFVSMWKFETDWHRIDFMY